MRIALMTNFIAPYRVPLFKQLRSHVDELRIFISTPMERDRYWEPTWGDLPVTVLQTLTWHQIVSHPAGFTERNAVYLPIDFLAHLDRFGPDLVIGGFSVGGLLASLYCLRRPETGLLGWATLSERSEASRGFLRKLLRRYIVSRLDAVIVNGASGARYLVGLGMAPDRIIRIPQAVNIGAFRGTRTRPPECAHRLLYVGQLIERKGLIQFIQALAQHATTESSQLEVWFAGDGPLRPAIESIPPSANLHIRILGHVPYDELPDVYRRCGILAFPTLSDEWGLVVNEAMAAGLPVLGSTYAQAVEELVQDGVNGWTFDPANPRGMGRAIKRAMATPTQALDAMRAAAMATVDLITPDRTAERMLEACRLVLRPRQHKRKCWRPTHR
jgi:glycosyltransferase involved in cell wall biosynthesis